MSMQDRVMDTTNMFRLADTGIVDGERWYTVWAHGEVLDWIYKYESKDWVVHEQYMVDMSEAMVTVLKLKFSNREIPNPYLHVIPTKNPFFGTGAGANAYREYMRGVHKACTNPHVVRIPKNGF